MKITELTTAWLEMIDLLDSTELDESSLSKQTIEENFKILVDVTDEKINNVSNVIKCLLKDSEIAKEESKRLANRAKSFESKANYLRDLLSSLMRSCERKKIETAIYTVSLLNPKFSIKIIDEKLIPDEFLIQQKPVIDKIAIKRKLNDGEIINGACLEEGKYSVTIR